jgi:hypothetical protein
MTQLEQNIISAFRNVKMDMANLRQQLEQLRSEQQQLMFVINDTREKEISLYQRMKGTKAPGPAKPKFFIASKQGKNVHEENCPFAKNIKPSRKVIFETRAAALEAGYKACECMHAC